MAKDAKWYAGYVRSAYAQTAEEKLTYLEAADFIEYLAAELEAVKRERDAAVHDLNMACCCAVCIKGMDKDYISNDCVDCDGSINFVWRGLCKENGGIEA